MIAALGLAGVFGMQRLGVRVKLAYVLPSVVAWIGIYASGVHPTIAGVIVGMVTPVRAWLGRDGFLVSARKELDILADARRPAPSSHELAVALHQVNLARREALSPAESLIETLHPWVAFGIMPIFALANAGVVVSGGSLDPARGASSWPSQFGLIVGSRSACCSPAAHAALGHCHATPA